MRGLLHALLASLLALAPGAALAAGAEGSVLLRFSDSDKIYIWISLGLGVVALLVAWWLTKWVMAISPGNDKMQEVGAAIREGALAYLSRQFKTMLWFIVALAIGLFFLYQNIYNSSTLGMLIAAAFVGGVLASYIAGYTGMKMAVEGNMRTANSALTSYKDALKVAFRSGAVAGMVTVGMGLIGASAIFLLAGEQAMKLLIGFGFGGSLAALFMRVGGGIFTKAADVGADLVGKIEAGIPEDDPRNPATIADNVGDNVGDCAGMAADIFESYEVTLVAAIVLGYATNIIFDQETWMKLILFALMARGVGIVASIFGVFGVKGSDDIDSDPLKAIRKGFILSAVIAAAGTVALAYFMMGPGSGTSIATSRFISRDEMLREQFMGIRAARQEMAKARKVQVQAIEVTDLKETPEFKALGLNEFEAGQLLPRVLGASDREVATLITEKGFRKIELDDTSNPILDYAVNRPGSEEPVAVRDAYKDAMLFELADVKPATPAAAASTWVFAASKAKMDEELAKLPKDAGKKILNSYPVELYANDLGDIAVAANAPLNPLRIGDPALQQAGIISADPRGSDQIVPMAASEVKKVVADQRARMAEVTKMFEDAQKATGPDKERKMEEARKAWEVAQKPTSLPPAKSLGAGMVDRKEVPWYMFALAILFGIAMAFAIELLTDYYVSAHKKPVREVAGVSSAGPAPMIIQGFALGLESSVFSVFAIVVALIAPLLFFPPADYGSYILSFYGIALVGLGLLTTTGYILAMDTFGPISDNAQGIFEMSGAGRDNPTAAKAVQRLDAAGNTTKALTKGFAIATAVVAAVALFHSYVDSAKLQELGLKLDIPEIFLGLMIGGAAPYLFSAFSINAVGRAAFTLINEVRDQFRKDPGILAGTSKPKYDRCVAIVTKAAQTELLGPGILAIALPAAVAFGFSIGKPTTIIGGMEYNLVGAQALGGFLAGAILSGQLMAVLLANSGGIWDNAKKLIEDGLYGGKGTDAHKAGIVCDTVGDPFKDTAGPALNPLIKVMNLVALLLVPVVIAPLSNGILSAITITCLAALAFSVWWSKRGSMSSAMVEAQETGGTVVKAVSAPAPEAPSAPPAGKKKITVEETPPPADEE